MIYQELKNSENNLKITSPGTRLRTRQPQPFIPGDEVEQVFSKQEVMFLCSIVDSSYIRQCRAQKTYWCTRNELVSNYSEHVLKQLKNRGAIEEWQHHDGFTAVTLTSWSAFILGVKLAEYWVRHIVKTQEYRGIGRKLARIRVQRWDTEAYWTPRNRPERSLRIPGNTCELPLIGDPEDKSHQRGQVEYLEDWQTWSFVKSPGKAINITIRVGSFAHKILIERDNRMGPKKHKKRKK